MRIGVSMAEEKFEPIFVQDGDTIVIVAKTQQDGPTVSDPCDETPFLSQAYRVVSDRVGPTLALVPLRTRAVRVSQSEIDQFNERERQEKSKATVAYLTALIETAEWKFGAPVIVSDSAVLNEAVRKQREKLDAAIEQAKIDRERFRADMERPFDPVAKQHFDPTGTIPGSRK